MKKKELIDVVSEEMDSTKYLTKNFLESFLNSIIKALNNGEDVSLIGFGYFRIVRMKARKGINLRTGEFIKIPERDKVKFIIGKNLKDSVKNKGKKCLK